MKIELGSKVKDIVNGFEGIMTGRAEYLTGCVQLLVAPDKLDKDGKMHDSVWLDQSRLVVVAPPNETIRAASAAMAAEPGGPQRDAPPTR
jgi:hypothetical protein